MDKYKKLYHKTELRGYLIQWWAKDPCGDDFLSDLLPKDVELSIWSSLNKGEAKGLISFFTPISFNHLFEGEWEILWTVPTIEGVEEEKTTDTTSPGFSHEYDVYTTEGKIQFIKTALHEIEVDLIKKVGMMPESWNVFELRWLIDRYVSSLMKQSRAYQKEKLYKKRFKEFVNYCITRLNLYL